MIDINTALQNARAAVGYNPGMSKPLLTGARQLQDKKGIAARRRVGTGKGVLPPRLIARGIQQPPQLQPVGATGTPGAPTLTGPPPGGVQAKPLIQPVGPPPSGPILSQPPQTTGAEVATQTGPDGSQITTQYHGSDFNGAGGTGVGSGDVLRGRWDGEAAKAQELGQLQPGPQDWMQGANYQDLIKQQQQGGFVGAGGNVQPLGQGQFGGAPPQDVLARRQALNEKLKGRIAGIVGAGQPSGGGGFTGGGFGAGGVGQGGFAAY